MPKSAIEMLSAPVERDIRVSRLPNGLRIVTDQVPHVMSAAVGLWIDAGSRYETADENGMSHLLEHMLFKGTARRSARALAEEIEAVGGHLNAWTSRDHTSFHARVLAKDVPLAVDLLADMLQNSRFDPDELDREREVILQEIGQAEDTPDDIVFDHLQDAAFPGQPLGRPILGTAERIRAFRREDLFSYLGRNYRAGNTVLAAAGRVDHDALVALCAEAFAGLPEGGAAGFERAGYRGCARHDRRPTEQLHLTLGFPGVAFDDRDYYAAQVFSTMLGGGMSSRLFQEVRENRGLAYSVYSFTGSHADTGLLGIYAGTAPALAPEMLKVIADETLKLAEPAGEDEVARARAQLKAGLLMSLESSSARIEQIGRQILIFGRPLSLAEMVDAVDEVDAGRVAALCRRLLTEGRPAVATVGPKATRLPDHDGIRALFQLS